MNDALSNPRLIARFQSQSRFAALLVIGMGSLVVLGWVLASTPLQTLLPGLTTMKFNTALCFILSGLALLRLRSGPSGLVLAFSLVVTFIALVTLAEYVFGWNLGIDQLLMHDVPTAINSPGRMSPITTLIFCLVGSSLLLFARTRRLALAQSLTLVGGFTTLLALVGYLYGVQSLYQISTFTSIALSTALTFVFLCVGMFLVYPEHGLMSGIASNFAGGRLARRLLPASLLIPLVLGWLRLKGEQAGHYDALFGLALFTLSNIVTFTILIFWTARSLNHVDLIRAEEEGQRRQADEAVKRYTQRLSMLHDIDRGILEATSIPAVIETALKHIRRLIPCQRVSVILFDWTTEEWLIFADDSNRAYSLGREIRTPIPPNWDEGFGTAQVRVLNDLRLIQKPLPVYRQLIQDGLVSGIQALLMDREQPMGLLGLNANTPGFFTVEHEEIALEVASQIAIAILQLRLSEELAHYTAELERNVTDLRQTQAALHQANDRLEIRVRERTSELTRTNQALEEQITEREQAENQFRALLESAPDAIIIVNSDGEILLVNIQTEKVFGYSREELVGQPIERLIPDSLRSRHIAHRTEYVADPHVRGMGVGLELYALRKDGSRFPVEISLSPIQMGEGILIASAIRDITEDKRLEKQNFDLALDRERFLLLSQFVRDTSHDLRTPLAIINTSAYMLRKLPLDKQLDKIEMIEAQSGYINKMIETIHYTAQLWTTDHLDLQPVALDSLIDGVCDRIAPKMNAKKQHLKVITAPVTILAESNYLAQAFAEVLDNASRFTPENGDIQVRLSIQEDVVVVEIKDDGIGMNEAEVGKAFEMFWKADSSRSDSLNHHGLGLTIAHHIVHLHHGSIQVESQPKIGTTFTISLPVPR